MVFKRHESIEKPNEQPLNEQAQTDETIQPSDVQEPVEEQQSVNEQQLTQQQPAEPQTIEQTASEEAKDTQTEAEQPQPVSEKAEAAPQKDKPHHDRKKQKKTEKVGKNGRPLKTDPYGNPVKKRKKDAPLRKPEPVRTVTPADIQKPQVSFMNAIANLEPASRARWTGATTEQAYDHAVRSDTEPETQEAEYQPKIRRMSDSTRAKELRKRRRGTETLPYEKDSPEQHPQAAPTSPKRKKQKITEAQTDRIPEQFMEQPYEEVSAPTDLIEKAEYTQINLAPAESEGIDIDVHYHEERRKRSDLPKQAKDFKHPEDKISIRHDIDELKMTLSLRVVLVGIVTVISCLLTLLDWIPAIPLPSFLSSSASPRSYLLIQILLGVLAIPVSGDLLRSGFKKLISFKADCDSLAACAITTAELSALTMLFFPTLLQNGIASVYIAVGLLAVWMNAISKKMIVTRAQRNFDILSGDEPKYAIHYVEDEKRAENLTRGTLGDLPILATMQPANQITDFLRYTFSSDLGDHICKLAVPIILGISLIFSVFLAILRADSVANPICYGIAVFALCIAAAACAGITLVSNLPMALGTKQYVRGSGLLLGYQSVDDFYDVNTVMVDAATLFPQSSTKLESIQVVGESRIEEALQYAASLTQHAGSILKDLFSGAILTEEQMLLPVEDYGYDEGSGISGWIHNKRVLLGKREMMVEHSIEGLPAPYKEDELTNGSFEAIYLSVSGTVSAMFIVSLTASRSVKKWLHELEREDIHLLVRSNDALLSQRRLSRMFGFPEELLKIIPTRMEQDYVAETKPLETASPSMVCAGRLPGFIQTIVGAKRIYSTAMLGAIMQVVSACLGILCVFIFLLLHAYNYVTGGIMLIYHVLWTLLTIATLHMKDV